MTGAPAFTYGAIDAHERDVDERHERRDAEVQRQRPRPVDPIDANASREREDPRREQGPQPAAGEGHPDQSPEYLRAGLGLRGVLQLGGRERDHRPRGDIGRAANDGGSAIGSGGEGHPGSSWRSMEGMAYGHRLNVSDDDPDTGGTSSHCA